MPEGARTRRPRTSVALPSAGEDSLARRSANPRSPPYTVGFYLVAEFPMMAFAAAIEPLRAANRLSGERLYEWRLYTRDGGPAQPSNGLAIDVASSIRDAAV